VIEIRSARTDDAEVIADIYAHHVLHGTASFEQEPPDAASWREKIEAITSRGWPFLVSDRHGKVVGYAYATQFRDRSAYTFTCENSIYVAATELGKGIGGNLLAALIQQAEAAGFRQMIGVIGGAEAASVALHQSAGFTEAGRMRSVGRKFGRWLDTLYMQRTLGPGDSEAPKGER
jgi:L-amino acid N-acyltransferase YncA